MNPPDRQRLKLASYIVEQVTQHIPAHGDRITSLVSDVVSLTGDLGCAHRRLEICQTRDWDHAARQQGQALQRLCNEIISTAANLRELSQNASAPQKALP